jgi:hypothetical protein
MQEKECEHEWDESEDIDKLSGLVDLNPQFVQIQVRCCKCGKRGLTDADTNWKPVYWDCIDLSD